MLEIYTLTDWMQALAEAMRNSDTDTIEQLQAVSRDWLQSSDETEAQLHLCESALELVYDLVEN